MNIRFLLPLIFAVCCVPTSAETLEPAIPLIEKEESLKTMEKWKGFEGTWEGEVRYVAGAEGEWTKKRQEVRVDLGLSGIKVSARLDGGEWTELTNGRTSVFQPDPLTILIHAYGAGGVWTENVVFILTRRSEDDAELFAQRVVNNWAGKSLPGEMIFGDSRTGSVKRKPKD